MKQPSKQKQGGAGVMSKTVSVQTERKRQKRTNSIFNWDHTESMAYGFEQTCAMGL